MDLEAAYRFVENQHVAAEKILDSSAKATIARCEGQPYAIVPVDQSSIALADPHQTRGTRNVGTYKAKGRGLQVMSAIGVDPQGATLGLLHQVFWAREEDKACPAIKAKRGIEEKETRYWMAVCKTVCARFQEAKSTVIPCFQIDRGGDFKELLTWVHLTPESEARITIRGTYNRRLAAETNQTYARDHLRSQPVVATYEVEVDDENRKQSHQKKTKDQAGKEVRASRGAAAAQKEENEARENADCQTGRQGVPDGGPATRQIDK